MESQTSIYQLESSNAISISDLKCWSGWVRMRSSYSIWCRTLQSAYLHLRSSRSLLVSIFSRILKCYFTFWLELRVGLGADDIELLNLMQNSVISLSLFAVFPIAACEHFEQFYLLRIFLILATIKVRRRGAVCLKFSPKLFLDFIYVSELEETL